MLVANCFFLQPFEALWVGRNVVHARRLECVLQSCFFVRVWDFVVLRCLSHPCRSITTHLSACVCGGWVGGGGVGVGEGEGVGEGGGRGVRKNFKRVNRVNPTFLSPSVFRLPSSVFVRPLFESIG